MDNINENNDIIKSFKEFQKKSRKKYKNLVNRIKDEKKYISTTQYSKNDIEVLGEDRTKNQLNVVKNAIRTIVNTYRETPYRWRVVDKMTNKDSETMNAAGINFLENPDNATAAIEALESATSFGLGVLVLTTDYGVDGNPEPVMYSISNLDNVYLDPDITKTNGADARAAAIVELKSREWVESEYGIDISTIDKPMVDIDEEYDRKDYMPLVTYYKKDKNGVTVYRMIGNEIVDAIALPLTYIPIVPVFGEKCYEDEKLSWTGIVSQMEGVQKLINYAYTNVLIRLAVSPKNQWITDSESIEGNESYFKNSNKTLNPLLIYNSWSSDRKRELPKPERLSNEIPLGDVGEMFSQSLQMVNNIIGIPAIGLESEVEKSATEVLTNEKTFQNNVRTYMWNLRSSLVVAGMCFFELLSNQPLWGAVKITMVQGPDEGLKKQEARVILQSMQPLLTEPQDQRKLLLAMANVESENEYVRSLVEILQPMPTAQEMKDQELLGQADAEIKQRDMQIAQLQKQLEDEKRQSELKAYSLERELTLAQIKHQQEMEKMLLQHRLDGELTDKDLMEMSAENSKNQMELEKEAISLDREKTKVAMENEVQMVKSAAEFAKAEGNAKVARAKAEQSLAKAKEINAKKENK
jgi:hypothetical protein